MEKFGGEKDFFGEDSKSPADACIPCALFLDAPWCKDEVNGVGWADVGNNDERNCTYRLTPRHLALRFLIRSLMFFGLVVSLKRPYDALEHAILCSAAGQVGAVTRSLEVIWKKVVSTQDTERERQRQAD